MSRVSEVGGIEVELCKKAGRSIGSGENVRD